QVVEFIHFLADVVGRPAAIYRVLGLLLGTTQRTARHGPETGVGGLVNSQLLEAEVDYPGGFHWHCGDSRQFIPKFVECLDRWLEAANPCFEVLVVSYNRGPQTSDSNILVVDPELGYAVGGGWTSDHFGGQ